MTEGDAQQPQPSRAPARRPPIQVQAQRFPGTFGLIAATLVVFAFQWATSAALGFDAGLAFGAKDKTALAAGQWWRILSPIFLHVGPLHLLVNMYSLYAIGPAVERYFGTPRMVAFYILTGVAGVMFSLALTPARSAGASGAIFGLLGEFTAFLYLHRGTFGRAGAVQLRQLVIVALLNLGLGFSAAIDNWGHLGGLVSGAALAYALGPRFEPLWDDLGGVSVVDVRPWARVRNGAAMAGAAILALTVAAAILP